jgi:hypothetical protein
MCGSTLLAPEHFAGTSADAIPTGTLEENESTMPKWFIVIAISLVVTPVLRIYSVFASQLPALSNPEFQPYLDSHNGLRNLLYFEIIMNIGLAVAALLLNYYFYTKSRRFPPVMIGYAVTTFLYLVAVTGATRLLFPDANVSSSFMPLVRTLFWAGILIPYLILEPAVKQRFQS